MIAFWWNDWPGSELTTPVDRPDRHRPGRRRRGRADHRRPGHRRAIRPPRSVRGQPRSRRSHHISRHPGVWPARRSQPRSSCPWSANAGRWAVSGGCGPASPRSRCPGRSGIGAYFLFVNLDAVPAAERAAAGLRNPGGPIAGTGLRLRAHRRRGLAGGVLHRPARLARQHDHPRARPPARRQRPRPRPRRADLHRAPQPGALAASRHQRRLRMRHQRGAHRRRCCSKAGQPRGCPPRRAAR